MQINKIIINNFRGIEKQSIKLLPNINVFVGVNGSGKSTILDSIAISLSWLINRIQRENSSGKPILELNIKNDAKEASIEIEVENNKETFNWTLTKSVRGYSSEEKSQLLEVSKLSSVFQDEYQKNNQLPMIVYYPVNRITTDISSMIRGRETIFGLDVYDNALGGQANFQSFFEWFRLQDDIVNEQSQSRSKWMNQHRDWTKRKILKIFSIFSFNEQNDGFNHLKKRLQNDDFLLDEPKYLFRELIDSIEHLDFEDINNIKIPHILHDLEYLLYQMNKLSDLNRDNAIGLDGFPIHHIEKLVEQIFYLIREQYQLDSIAQQKTIKFIWEMFLFSILLSFWWLSDKGKQNIEKVFQEFNPLQIKNRKLLENTSNNFIESIINIVRNDTKRLEQATYHEGRELKFVTKTIEKFVPEYSNMRVTRVPRPHMLVDKNGITIRLDQLSDGEKNMIAMIGDIARRLSMANPTMNNPLEGDGIVLIDEIDLHLHPSWQRLVIPKLSEIFPNCQFIVTTHSPQVLSHVKAEHIFLLKQERNSMTIVKPTESYGKSSDRILEDILGTDARPLKIKEELHHLYKLIQDGKLDDAKNKINELENEIEGAEPELVKANVLIKRKEVLGK